ncbi:MAG: NAD(P)H-hydrate dehydratase [Alphaproteobacteria bacterium]|nr:MAG: NAD(P)H-hydrate dehydratase [Alphaproteobacteria bacterium]
MELLTIDEMYEADRLAIRSGVSGLQLMEAAGRGVASAVTSRRKPGRALILCGPGNNGGDGFVAARVLEEAGWSVDVALLGRVEALKGDAAHMAGLWTGHVRPLDEAVVDDQDVIIDALFGAGLTRPIEGAVANVIARANAHPALRVAVDVPSGIDGDSGQVRGTAFEADVTVTFFRRKPGHLLLPGRLQCGVVEVVDIGTPAAVLDQIAPRTWRNDPALWLAVWPWPTLAGHKYSRGHTLVVSGPLHATGAATLAAYGALRIGSGLVTVACPEDALPALAGKLTAVMTSPFGDAGEFAGSLDDARKNALLLGPGNGVTDETRTRVDLALATGRAVVLDADALTVFADRPDDLFKKLHEKCVITPHDGEFFRLFPDLRQESSKLHRARVAARRAGCVLVLKGADTVVASPDGRAVINDNAPPDLATAGAGDVLAGMIAGLRAQGVPAFEAAAAGVWVHGQAASRIGAGLIAEDLWGAIPGVLGELKGMNRPT